VSARFYDSAVPSAERRELLIKTAHMATPETPTSTHYFIVHGREFALNRPDITAFMHEQLFGAFQEDVCGLEAIERALGDSREEDLYEISVASDSAAVAMRRYLKRRAELESTAGRVASLAPAPHFSTEP
jgi:hypothetical protein